MLIMTWIPYDSNLILLNFIHSSLKQLHDY